MFPLYPTTSQYGSEASTILMRPQQLEVAKVSKTKGILYYFSGEDFEKVEEWIQQFEDWGELSEIPTKEYYAYLALALHGLALSWWISTGRHLVKDWNIIKSSLLGNFSNKLSGFRYKELYYNCKQLPGERVQSYAFHLNSLAAMVENKAETRRFRFLEGLSPQLKGFAAACLKSSPNLSYSKLVAKVINYENLITPSFVPLSYPSVNSPETSPISSVLTIPLATLLAASESPLVIPTPLVMFQALL